MNGSKEFETVEEAKSYLEQVTDFKMPTVEWSMIGKLLKKETDGSLVPALDIPGDSL